LQLQSQPGQGTRVELLLPPGQASVAPVHPAPSLLDVTDPGVHVGNLLVLVIDDEPDIRDAMQSLLEQLGCVAVCTDSQAGALALVRAGFRPAVILADHRLREGDGLSALAALRAELGEVATLVVTGDTAPQTLANVLASGHRVLHKPVDGATLARALREVTATGQ
jgi:CheY-like chemotaxis protein